MPAQLCDWRLRKRNAEELCSPGRTSYATQATGGSSYREGVIAGGQRKCQKNKKNERDAEDFETTIPGLTDTVHNSSERNAPVLYPLENPRTERMDLPGAGSLELAVIVLLLLIVFTLLLQIRLNSGFEPAVIVAGEVDEFEWLQLPRHRR